MRLCLPQFSFLTFCLVVWAPCSAEPPWKTNAPIAVVQRELYLPRPEGSSNIWLITEDYVGAGLERMEITGVQVASDIWQERQLRWSFDNGVTWSDPSQLPNNDQSHRGVNFWEGGGAVTYDPKSKRLVGVWLRQVNDGGIIHNFTYYRLSDNHGQTWSEPKQLRYESGPEFDSEDPLNSEFLTKNQAYFGNNILIRSDGKLVHAVGHANDPNDPKNNSRPWRMASLCFIGTWNPQAQDYVWTAGARVAISPKISARGLGEPEVVELKNKRLAVVWRGSTHGWDGTIAEIPGRKFFSLSSDGGVTLTEPAEFKYDDGTSFYSPSSYHRMIRHSLTGKVYWVGNIAETPPVGNKPRFPLVIAEVDEDEFSLKKDTVTIIDTRREGDQERFELSNFSLLENRETRDIEVFLTRIGDPGGSDVYKYTISLKP